MRNTRSFLVRAICNFALATPVRNDDRINVVTLLNNSCRKISINASAGSTFSMRLLVDRHGKIPFNDNGMYLKIVEGAIANGVRVGRTNNPLSALSGFENTKVLNSVQRSGNIRYYRLYLFIRTGRHNTLFVHRDCLLVGSLVSVLSSTGHSECSS